MLQLFSLTTKAEFLNQSTILGNVLTLQVLKQAFPLANHHNEAAASCVVLLKFVEMLGKAFDTVGEKCDLTFDGAGIVFVTAVLLEDFVLLLDC